MTSEAPVPVTVLSGFLGAGKTTLLRRAVQSSEAGDLGIIINEFGSISLDHELVIEAPEQPAVVSGGCACCSRREELVTALRCFLDQRDSGHRAKLDRVVIETSGLTDPAPIAFTINSDPVLKHHFRVDSIVTVVDGVAGMAQIDAYPEAMAQVAVADRLIVSKLDLAGTRPVEQLLSRIRQLNPLADIDYTDDASVLAPLSRLSRRRTQGRGDSDDPKGRHTAGIESLSLELTQPLDWVAFGVWLTMLLHRHGERIPRIKGMVDAEEYGLVSINSVGHVISSPEHIKLERDSTQARLVFVLHNLSASAVAASFHTFQFAAGMRT